jgi:hypothetical protein
MLVATLILKSEDAIFTDDEVIGCNEDAMKRHGGEHKNISKSTGYS